MAESQETLLPKVLVVSTGNEIDHGQNYSDVEYLFASKGDNADVFNSAGLKKSFNVLVFMTKEYKFTDSESLRNLVGQFWTEELATVGAMYTDLAVDLEGGSCLVKNSPSFARSVYNSKQMLNIPFIVKSSVVPTFNQNVANLNLWDGLLSLMRNTIVFHTAHTFFTIKNMGASLVNIEKDVEVINAIHK